MRNQGFFQGMNREQKRALSKQDQIRSIEQLAQVIIRVQQDLKQADSDVDLLLQLNTFDKRAKGEAVQKGDTAIIGIFGRFYKEDNETLQDMPFQGGVADNMLIKSMGGGEMIAGFDEGVIGKGVIGKGVGSQVEVVTNFPDDYHDKSLQGKKVNFVVAIHAAYAKTETTGTIAKLQDAAIRKLIEGQQQANKEKADAAEGSETKSEETA